MINVNKLTIEEILEKYKKGFNFDINNGQITRITVTGLTNVRNK